MLNESENKGVSYMSPFWNHILGFIYVEIAKIVATWKLAKLAKTNVSRFWGFEPGTNLWSQLLWSHHPPPHLLCEWPFCLYHTRIGYIWIHTFCWMYEFIGHRVYEFIWMNEFIGQRVYEFILFSVQIHIWWRDVWGAAVSLAAPHTSTQHIIIAPTN